MRGTTCVSHVCAQCLLSKGRNADCVGAFTTTIIIERPILCAICVGILVLLGSGADGQDLRRGVLPGGEDEVEGP